MTQQKYFDPRARVASVPTAPPPRAVSFPAPVPNAVYWDQRTSRPRSKYPTAEEVAAYFDGLPDATKLSLEQLASTGTVPGETALGLALRRCLGVPRCTHCRAPGGGDLGHRVGCGATAEENYRRANWWRFRRKQNGEVEEVEEDDDGLPF